MSDETKNDSEAKAKERQTLLGAGICIGVVIMIIGAFMARPPRNFFEKDPQTQAAQAKLDQWADKLDGNTKETGEYLQHPGPNLPDNDPWGTALKVQYKNDGVSESLIVSSAGADKSFGTPDDVEAHRMTTSFKGTAARIDKAVEGTSAKAARGAVKGVFQGMKDAVKGAFAKDDEAKPAPAADKPAAADAANVE